MVPLNDFKLPDYERIFEMGVEHNWTWETFPFWDVFNAYPKTPAGARAALAHIEEEDSVKVNVVDDYRSMIWFSLFPEVFVFVEETASFRIKTPLEHACNEAVKHG